MKKTNLQEILKGLAIITKAIQEEIETGVGAVPTEVESKKVVDIKEKMVKKDVQPETVEETEEVEADTNTNILEGMSLKELKDLAKELKVSTKGSKSAIMGRIIEAQDGQEEEEVEEVQEPETEVEEAEVEEVTNDLEEQLAEMTVEELADMLTDAGISAKGKKQALIGKIVKAVEEGKIELEFEDESEDAEEVEEDGALDFTELLEDLGMKELKAICKELAIKVVMKDKKPSLIEKINEADEKAIYSTLVALELIEDEGEVTEEVEIEEVEGSEEFEAVGSEARVEAVENKFAELMEQIDNKEITMEEVVEFFEEYHADNKSELKKIEKMEEEDLINNYCWIQSNLIDDEGEEVDFNTPFMVGEVPYCCGQPMKKLNDTTYVCTIDGEEVEVDGE